MTTGPAVPSSLPDDVFSVTGRPKSLKLIARRRELLMPLWCRRDLSVSVLVRLFGGVEVVGRRGLVPPCEMRVCYRFVMLTGPQLGAKRLVC